MQIIEARSPHEFVSAIYPHYQNNEKQLQPGIRRTLNDLLTSIYLDMDGIEGVCIDMFICDTEDQAPSWFRYIHQSGQSEMVIQISYDGEKKVTFKKIHWWKKFTRFVSENWQPVCSFLINILPSILALVKSLVVS